jgi:hypothetical protein
MRLSYNDIHKAIQKTAESIKAEFGGSLPVLSNDNLSIRAEPPSSDFTAH